MTQLDTTSSSTANTSVSRFNLIDRFIYFVASRFGDKSKEVERFMKFFVVGSIGAIIDFGMLFILQASVLAPVEPNKDSKVILATTIAFIVAVSSNFVWNRYWTYPDSRSRSIRRQLVQFFAVNTIGWTIRTVFIFFTFRAIGQALTPGFIDLMQQISADYVPSPEVPGKVGTMIAQFIALWIVMIWNFFVNRYWTYGDVK